MPVLAAVFCQRKRPGGKSWRMDETYIEVRSQWRYLYRVVDHNGDTVDFLLRAKRDRAAAQYFLEQAITLLGDPQKITIVRVVPIRRLSTATTPTIKPTSNCARTSTSTISSSRTNRAIKRIMQPMLGSKSTRYAHSTGRYRNHTHASQEAAGVL